MLFMAERSRRASLRKCPLSREAGVSQINVDKGTEGGNLQADRSLYNLVLLMTFNFVAYSISQGLKSNII